MGQMIRKTRAAPPARNAVAGRGGGLRRAGRIAALGVVLLGQGLLATTPAFALEPLGQEKYINDRLISARIADRIRHECRDIDGRLIYAWSQARALKKYALSKGYSEAQIDAFLHDKAEKQRIYAVAEDYMARKGAKAGDEASFCALGRAEIAAGTVIGSLLVAKR